MKEALILGLLQGVTEFLPVSSSGHLVLLQKVLGIRDIQLAFDTTLHAATMLATLIFFRKDLKDLTIGFFRGGDRERSYFYAIASAVVPTAVLGLLIEKKAKFVFGSPIVVGISFALTGLVLAFSRVVERGGDSSPRFFKGFLIGTVQGLAVIPGISRSGTTIVAGITLGISPEEAFRFSFLISIPAIAGAMLLNIVEGWTSTSFSPFAFAVGFVSAFLSGYLSLAFLRRTVVARKLHFFAIYVFAAAAVALFVVK